MNKTDQEKAEPGWKLANDRLGDIGRLEKETIELLKVVQKSAKTARQLIRQRDGLLDLIALAMTQKGGSK